MRVVEPAPETRQALRGNLYAIVDLVGENPGRAHLAESLLSAIQRTYFTRAGSQSQVLTEAVRQARLRVNEFNQSHPDQTVQLGVICAGLVRSRLMIVHSGPSFAFITADNQVVRYPTDVPIFSALPSPHAPAGLPAGQSSGGTGNWEIYSQDVDQHTALFMGTARWLDVVPVRTIAGSVAHINTENCGVAASGLLATSRRPDLPGLLLVVERTDTPPAAPAPKTPPPQRRSPLLGAAGLMTSVSASPPLVDVPQIDGEKQPPAAQPGTDLPKAEALAADQAPTGDSTPDSAPYLAAAAVSSIVKSESSAEEMPPRHDSEYDQADGEEVDDSLIVAPKGEPQPSDVSAESEPSGPSTMAKVSSGLAAGAVLGLDRAREILAGILPERRSASEIDYENESVQSSLAASHFPDGAEAYPDQNAWDEDLTDEIVAAGASAAVCNARRHPQGMALPQRAMLVGNFPSIRTSPTGSVLRSMRAPPPLSRLHRQVADVPVSSSRLPS